MNHFAIFLIKDIIKREHKRINAFREERGCGQNLGLVA